VRNAEAYSVKVLLEISGRLYLEHESPFIHTAPIFWPLHGELLRD